MAIHLLAHWVSCIFFNLMEFASLILTSELFSSWSSQNPSPFQRCIRHCSPMFLPSILNVCWCSGICIGVYSLVVGCVQLSSIHPWIPIIERETHEYCFYNCSVAMPELAPAILRLWCGLSSYYVPERSAPKSRTFDFSLAHEMSEPTLAMCYRQCTLQVICHKKEMMLSTHYIVAINVRTMVLRFVSKVESIHKCIKCPCAWNTTALSTWRTDYQKVEIVLSKQFVKHSYARFVCWYLETLLCTCQLFKIFF